MRFAMTLVLTVITMTLFGCERSAPEGLMARQNTAATAISSADQARHVATQPASLVPGEAQKPDAESLAAAQAQFQATERKIIQNADLTIELDAPEKTQRNIAAIAERHGGFIVTSETKQNSSGVQVTSQTTLTVIARVPAAKFNQAVEEIQGLGGTVIHRKLAGQDVTEEFIDLEARIRAKRALESQFLEIMKRAGKISEALEVQKELSNVRGEIEQMEGRRRFLENQAAFSTITITLQTPAPIVAATTGGFWHSVKFAFGDGLDTAAGIVIGLIRFVLVMIPVVLLILLPGWIIFRWLWRKVEWTKPSAAATRVDQG